ncbi:6-phosphogluconolactonase [Streptomyces himastatinicus ATCC 53653]|uniref:6-phosphogluconolactonase n=1 Tax=Streptomyces himastatinicus ATCC 53653 TaxID=457427 RepID=D9WAR4_9ACTN|nr:6-phosphogluconolactonase [Streptomyces himastatinicus ATCC 53653]
MRLEGLQQVVPRRRELLDAIVLQKLSDLVIREADGDQRLNVVLRVVRRENHGVAPTFDVVLVGVGPDIHVASLFPELPGVRETERTAVAVRGAPKPPPTRVSLTLPAIRAAREVWLLAAGEDKARAVTIALSGAGEIQAPAAGAYGRSRTLWLLDRAAASGLPRELYPPASP